jgi:hypothetical protein
VTDQDRYRTVARRADLLRRQATGTPHDYLTGYRHGMTRTLGESAPGQWEPTPEDEASEDLGRAARALGQADGRVVGQFDP